MKTIILLSQLLIVSFCYSNSYAPEPAAKIGILDAIKIAKDFAKNNKEDIENYYVDRAWLGYIPKQEERSWVISFANTEKGYYFVAVYMDGTAKKPKGRVYSENPFMEWNFKQVNAKSDAGKDKAKKEKKRDSSIPWRRPAGWENGLPQSDITSQ